MPEPLAPVSRGQPLRVPASTWNKVLDLVRDGLPADDPGGPRPVRGVQAQLTILVKNTTAGDLPVSPADLPYEFRREPVFAGAAPAAAADVPLVLAEAIPAGEFGRATVQGVTPVSVTGTVAVGDVVGCVVGQTGHMAAAAAGLARVLWVESGAGVRRAVVLLGGGGGGGGDGGSGGGRRPARILADKPPASPPPVPEDGPGLYRAGTLALTYDPAALPPLVWAAADPFDCWVAPFPGQVLGVNTDYIVNATGVTHSGKPVLAAENGGGVSGCAVSWADLPCTIITGAACGTNDEPTYTVWNRPSRPGCADDCPPPAGGV